MTLRQARCAFTIAIAELILFALSEGYEIALAEGMDRLTAKDQSSDHMKGSNHDIGLAQDLDLYLKGVYLMDTEDHVVLGTWWKEYGVEHGLPLVWGGDFSKPDGCHYSLRWKGVS
jgi:hypothetical protein